MSKAKRSSDVVEEFATQVLIYGGCGLAAFLFGLLLYAYKGMLMYVGLILMVGGLVAIGYAAYEFTQARKVTTFKSVCPYCSATNTLTEEAQESFDCIECHRMIPVENGRMLKVMQVRCGFCNHLNFYNENSVGLLCEECDRTIPIATADGELQSKAFNTYSRHDDDKFYDLVLTDPGKKTEEVISCLQHMLALNRNNVKQMFDEVPVVLLTGINKMKADMLAAQVESHGAITAIRETPTQS
ncbi:MAG: hypothetical protein JNJ45_06395 [Chthonomonas sp.]|nr:hypothetical protein [Chthonomonas sp.]